MTLPLTPEMLEAAYEYLKTTPPFKKWKLPDSDDVGFNVSADPTIFGRWDCIGVHHSITVSYKNVGFSETLLSVIAHEITHMHLQIIGKHPRRSTPDTHSALFKKKAAQICRYHGFDPKAFW